MAQIDKPNLHFNTVLYTGNGTDNRAVTGVGFQPDLTWIKETSNSASSHAWWDAVRGVTKKIESDNNQAEGTDATGLKSFDSDGYTLGTSAQVNQNGVFNASWSWKAGGGQGSSNTDGSINTTYTSVNTTAGFSISKYTGTGANATVGHGLGAVPKMIIVKDLNNSNNWYVYHASIGNTHGLRLSTNDAQDDDNTLWNDTTPTSSVFSVGSNTGTNRSGNPMIAYCFAEKKGYSKFSEYSGNGNADGTFVYTGFKPAFVMVKRYDGSGLSWRFFDSKRNYNGDREFMYANLTDEEVGGDNMDFLSNGFKSRNTSGHQNGNGDDYIYMAFAENPIVGSNNIPATAK